MGMNIYESDDEMTIATRISAGSRLGLSRTQPTIAICTRPRSRTEDYVVLTLEEAEGIAKAILAAIAEE